jgi:uncharacterized repeat protein (TIGR03803 family)
MLLSVSARLMQPETLYRFPSDQGHPAARLIQGKDGKFYGTTALGGRYGLGTVFQVTTNGVLTTLADFDGTNGTGGLPQSTLVLGSDNKFYGTSYHGGSEDNGTVFQVTTNGVLTPLVSLPHTVPWTYQGGLVLGNVGTFYDTTFGDNGPASTNFGSVFQVTANGGVD